MKRRFAASSTSPPERLTFFVDRSLGRRRLAEAIRAAGHDVVVHDDLFAADAPDETWLRKAGEEGWIVLTKDQRIRYRELEKRALVQSRVRAFVFTQKKQAVDDIIASFLESLPTIVRAVEDETPPFLASIQSGGRVRILISGR